MHEMFLESRQFIILRLTTQSSYPLAATRRCHCHTYTHTQCSAVRERLGMISISKSRYSSVVLYSLKSVFIPSYCAHVPLAHTHTQRLLKSLNHASSAPAFDILNNPQQSKRERERSRKNIYVLLMLHLCQNTYYVFL